MSNTDSKTVVLTVALITRDDEVLLGMTKRGFGLGMWNGPGGKFDSEKDGDDIKITAHRELQEEVGIDVKNLKEFAVVRYHLLDGKILETHFFKGDNFDGEPIETEEMKPKWFKINNPPLEEMFDGDRDWWKLFEMNKEFDADIYYDENKKVIESTVMERKKEGENLREPSLAKK